MQSRALIALAFLIACGGKQSAGDAGTDASGDAASCSYQETRTSSDRTCSAASDCVVVTRQLTCCQEQYEGIRADAAAKFQADQTALTSSCAACGCFAEPQDELGVKGTVFFAACESGLCVAHAQTD